MFFSLITGWLMLCSLAQQARVLVTYLIANTEHLTCALAQGLNQTKAIAALNLELTSVSQRTLQKQLVVEYLPLQHHKCCSNFESVTST